MAFTAFCLLMGVTSEAASLWQKHFLSVAVAEFSLQFFQDLENQSHCFFPETPHQLVLPPLETVSLSRFFSFFFFSFSKF